MLNDEKKFQTSVIFLWNFQNGAPIFLIPNVGKSSRGCRIWLTIYRVIIARFNLRLCEILCKEKMILVDRMKLYSKGTILINELIDQLE